MRYSSHPRSTRGRLFLALLLIPSAVLLFACQKQTEDAAAPAAEDGTQVAANQSPAPPEPAPAPRPPASHPPATPPSAARSEAAPVRQAEQAQEAPAPPPVVYLTVPESTTLKVRIEDALNSGTNQAGDPFRATLVDPVVVGDRVALPAGAALRGTVTDVIPAKKGMKESGGSLTLSFDHVTTGSGQSVPVNASISEVAKSTKKKAGTIGGAAAGGALLGKVLGGSTKDAALGAVVGGAIGTGVAAGTKGTEMKIEAGTELTISLQEPLKIPQKR
jgi:hypothetical protein